LKSKISAPESELLPEKGVEQMAKPKDVIRRIKKNAAAVLSR
jgi:hypothetical protein